eukprot:UN05767
MALLLTLKIIVFATYTQLFRLTSSQTPDSVCVSGGTGNLEYLNGGYELEGTHNGFPYYSKEECITQYLFAGWWGLDEIHYYLFYDELITDFPDLFYIVECGSDTDWDETPSDPTQCKGPWITYYGDADYDYNVTSITVVSGECETESCSDIDSESESDSESNENALFEAKNDDINIMNDNSEYTKNVTIDLSQISWIYVWIMFGTILLVNVFCVWWIPKE